MVTRKLKYSREEFAKRGKALYESHIRAQVEEGNDGKIVAIDVESGDYAIAEDSISASNLLQQRRPEALSWFVRVGHPTVHRIGATSTVVTDLVPGKELLPEYRFDYAQAKPNRFS